MIEDKLITLFTTRLYIKSANTEFSKLYLDYKIRNRIFHKEWSPLNLDEYYTLPHIKDVSNKSAKMFLSEQAFKFLIFEKNNENLIIGDFNFSNIIKGVSLSCHLGYQMDKDYINRGLMEEALTRGIDFFFNDKKYHRIEANMIPKNVRSIRLLEKLGFQKEGFAKNYLKINGKWEDHIHYTLLNNAIE